MEKNSHNPQGSQASRDRNDSHSQSPHQPPNSYSSPSEYRSQTAHQQAYRSENEQYSIRQQDQRPLPQQRDLSVINSRQYFGSSFTDKEADDLIRQTVEATPEEVFPEQDEENIAERERDEVPDLRRHERKYISLAPRNLLIALQQQTEDQRRKTGRSKARGHLRASGFQAKLVQTTGVQGPTMPGPQHIPNGTLLDSTRLLGISGAKRNTIRRNLFEAHTPRTPVSQ